MRPARIKMAGPRLFGGRMTGPRRGVTYCAMAVSMMSLLGMLALTVDIGTLYIARQQLQNAADAGALAGAGALRHGTSESEIRGEIAAVAATNEVLGEAVTIDPQSDVQIGIIDDQGAWVAGWPEQGLPMVRVTARRGADTPEGPVHLTFAGIFGVGEVDMGATATAGVTGGHTSRDPVEIVIAQDASGSFVEELPAAKEADCALVGVVEDAVIEGDTFGVNRFRGSVDRMASLTSVQDGADSIRSAVNAIEYATDLESGTNTAVGIQDAADMLVNQTAPDTKRVIVLVSDGWPEGPAEYEWNYSDSYGWYQTLVRTSSEVTADRRQAAVDAADAAAAQGITIHTVTFIQDSTGDAEFNASLTRNGGFAFDTPEPADLHAILETVGHIEVGRPYLVQ
ncbi:MAG: VWA domain-containing protein [Armatimonadia bacterium]|nr:VWA domain-containing protein [Armatimonadia bacterium]